MKQVWSDSKYPVKVWTKIDKELANVFNACMRPADIK